MMKYWIAPLIVLIPINSWAHSDDDPLLTMVKLDQFEWRDAEDENPLILEAQAWLGYDLNKMVLKLDLEQPDDDLEEAELQALYSRAISPYWDLQLGYRYDLEPKPSQDWWVLGLQGLAPYFFELDSALFVGDENRVAMRINAEYELLFTQQWILSPELELNFYGQNDAERQTGSGLSDAQFGLRLRYEFRREFAPYIGVNWKQWYGNAADYRKSDAEDTRIAELVVELRMPAGLSPEQRQRLEEIAHGCPVARSLHPDVKLPLTFSYPD